MRKLELAAKIQKTLLADSVPLLPGADIAASAGATAGGQVEEAEKKLADAYAGIFRAFLKHDDVLEMVTFWGVNDAVSWRRRGSPLLFDGNNEPKLAFDAVVRTAANALSPQR